MTRTAFLAALAALLSLPLPALALCGDGVLDPAEQCDDGNTAAADGCSASCRFEQLCVVTNDLGSPASVSVTELGLDGTLAPVTSTALPGALTTSRSRTAARCGRFVYVVNGGDIEGFEVGLDGSLTPLPGVVVTGFALGLVCNEEQGLLFAFDDVDNFAFSHVISYQVGPTGGLTLSETLDYLPFFSVVHRIAPDLHPTTDEIWVLGSYNPPPGIVLDVATISRISYDASGDMTLEQSVELGTFPDGNFGDDMRFTRDAAYLGVTGFVDSALGPGECFAHYDAPGPTIPPFANLNNDCATLPEDPTGFEVRPGGGPIFYYQSAGGALRSVRYSGSTIAVEASITPTHETNQLLAAYGGRVLVSLGPSELATYLVGANEVSLVPRDDLALTGDPDAAVVIACPALGPVTGIPVPPWVLWPLAAMLLGAAALLGRNAGVWRPS